MCDDATLAVFGKMGMEHTEYKVGDQSNCDCLSCQQKYGPLRKGLASSATCLPNTFDFDFPTLSPFLTNPKTIYKPAWLIKRRAVSKWFGLSYKIVYDAESESGMIMRDMDAEDLLAFLTHTPISQVKFEWGEGLEI